jgi:hypothetical protein
VGVGSGGVKSSIAGAEERVVVNVVDIGVEDEGSGGIDGEGFGGARGEDVVPAKNQYIIFREIM